METRRPCRTAWVVGCLIALAVANTPARAEDPPEAVFAGALDITDSPADRKRVGVFAGFVESNAGKVVRIAIQVRAPAGWPTSVFSSWARLRWRAEVSLPKPRKRKSRKSKKRKTKPPAGPVFSNQEGPLIPGAALDKTTLLLLAFCRCDGNLEAPYMLDFVLKPAAGAARPDLSWVDGRLLVRGRFRVVGPTRVSSVRHFRLEPAPSRAPAAAPPR